MRMVILGTVCELLGVCLWNESETEEKCELYIYIDERNRSGYSSNRRYWYDDRRVYSHNRGQWYATVDIIMMTDECKVTTGNISTRHRIFVWRQTNVKSQQRTLVWRQKSSRWWQIMLLFFLKFEGVEGETSCHWGWYYTMLRVL